MPSILLSLPDLYQSYKRWISENPLKANDYELTFKWVSYLVAGKCNPQIYRQFNLFKIIRGQINNSHVVSEMIYCLTNLLVLFNDNIIRKEHKLAIKGENKHLKVYLTVLEYSEVFLELSAKKLWGNSGKWFITTCIQIFKCFCRLLLVYKYKEAVVLSPPIPLLVRSNINGPENTSDAALINDSVQHQVESVSFNLKRSGKVIRKVDASPPLHIRNWKPVPKTAHMHQNNEALMDPMKGELQHKLAEAIYICKPLVHLGTIGLFGEHSWKPFILSLIMDCTSIHLHDNTNHQELDLREKHELVRRYMNLLCYLMRSPFYDRYSRQKINGLMNVFSKIPILGVFSNALNNYIPYWQGNYSHVWSI